MSEREFKRRDVKGAWVNMSLSAPPSHEKVVRALLDLEAREARGEAIYGSSRWHGAFSANVLAGVCGVEGARRGGRGAVKGSWSGTMSGSLRISPTLRAMENRGLLDSYYDTVSYRKLYSLTDKGRELVKS